MGGDVPTISSNIEVLSISSLNAMPLFYFFRPDVFCWPLSERSADNLSPAHIIAMIFKVFCIDQNQVN
jgi:hypothetical protein